MAIPEQLIPLNNYLRESLAFIATHGYLLSGEILSLTEPESEFGKTRLALNQKIPKVYGGPVNYLVARLFISYVASFEVFLQDTAVLVAKKNPKKVGGANFTLAEIIDSGGMPALVQRATDEFLNKLMYKKPSAYLQELCQLLSIDASPFQERWKVFVEAKARRDLGVHSAWRCNDVYLRKLGEAGIETTARPGDIMLPPDTDYTDSVMDKLNDLAAEITARVATVHWPEVKVEQLDISSDT